MNIFIHDGVAFDLDRAHQDVFGTTWAWTGTWSAAHEPLMIADSSQPGCRAPQPLPDVYRDFGPLITLPGHPTFAQRRAAIDVDPNYADTVAAGYVETPAEFGARIAKPAVITPANTSAFIKALRRVL